MNGNKQYFKRTWEEEFYIFDSQTISEKVFDEKVEYEDYRAFEDSLSGDEVCNLLNELFDENEKLKKDCKSYTWYKQYKKLLNENEQLKRENNELKSLCKVLITHIKKNSIAFVIDEDVRRLLE